MPKAHRPLGWGGSRRSDAVETDAAAKPDFAEPARSSALIPRRLDARGGQCDRPREVEEGAQAPGLEEQAAGTETPATPAAATASTLGAASQRGSATSPSTGLAPRRNSTSFNATMRESSTGCCPTTSLSQRVIWRIFNYFRIKK